MRSANFHQLNGTGRGLSDPLDQRFGNFFVAELIDEFHIDPSKSNPPCP
jgi:hypothetical protein